jgi:hypothetical protein
MEEIIPRKILGKLKEYQRIIESAINNYDSTQLLQLKLALSTANEYIPSLKEELKNDLNKDLRRFFERELEIWLEKKEALLIAIENIEKYLRQV